VGGQGVRAVGGIVGTSQKIVRLLGSKDFNFSAILDLRNKKNSTSKIFPQQI
jgi:hypothetical protein